MRMSSTATRLTVQLMLATGSAASTEATDFEWGQIDFQSAAFTLPNRYGFEVVDGTGCVATENCVELTLLADCAFRSVDNLLCIRVWGSSCAWPSFSRLLELGRHFTAGCAMLVQCVSRPRRSRLPENRSTHLTLEGPLSFMVLLFKFNWI
jgi:hypothetical protein